MDRLARGTALRLGALMALNLLVSGAGSVRAQQPPTLTLDGLGQTYQPAGLVNLEARVRRYPWLRAETQVWLGASPQARADGVSGDVVVLVLDVRDPEGRAELRAGRFVLTTGAVRPVHVDGGHVRLRAESGTSFELFAGSPVVAEFAERDFDWLVGGRLGQSLGEYGAFGVSYLHRRDFGELSDHEVGLDMAFLPAEKVDLAARASYDLTFQGLSELSATAARGDLRKRLEVFARYRNPSRMLPATSLFSVLSQTASGAAGASASYLWFPRLRVFSEAAYKRVAAAHGASLMLGGRLALDAEGAGFLEGRASRQDVPGARWTALRCVLAQSLFRDVRAGGELEVVVPDEGSSEHGRVWPWARLWARWQIRPSWLVAAALEGSASPQFARLFSAMLRLHFVGGTS